MPDPSWALHVRPWDRNARPLGWSALATLGLGVSVKGESRGLSEGRIQPECRIALAVTALALNGKPTDLGL
jgi:hypothetical protein